MRFSTLPGICRTMGISRTLFNKSWPKNSTSHKFSYLRSSTYSYYQIIGSPRNYADEWQVCARAAVLSVAGNLLAAKMNPTSSAWKFLSTPIRQCGPMRRSQNIIGTKSQVIMSIFDRLIQSVLMIFRAVHLWQYFHYLVGYNPSRIYALLSITSVRISVC